MNCQCIHSCEFDTRCPSIHHWISYHWIRQVSINFPQIPNSIYAHKKDHKNSHKLDAHRTWQHQTSEMQPKPPRSRKWSAKTKYNECIKVISFLKSKSYNKLPSKVLLTKLPQLHRPQCLSFFYWGRKETILNSTHLWE